MVNAKMKIRIGGARARARVSDTEKDLILVTILEASILLQER